MARRHGTAVEIGGRAVLIEGPPGSGKSRLALQLIDRKANLISDDQVDICERGQGAVLKAIVGFEGKLEARGLGIVEVPVCAEAPLALVVRLVDRVARLPEPRRCRIGGTAVPLIEVESGDPLAALYVELSLNGRVMPLD